MRTRKKKWTARELAQNPRVIRDMAEYARKLRGFFNDGLPIHLELGCGKGQFIARMATRHPEAHFVAVERDPTILAAAARLSASLNAPVLFFMLDAKTLAEVFVPGDIARLYVNFCDPWQGKKKWAKRRLTHRNFLEIYDRLEIPEIFFKTDNRELFAFSLESFSENGWKLRNISLDLHRAAREGADAGDANAVARDADDDAVAVTTEYEEKFSALGQPIYRLETYKTHIKPIDK
ncbi:MAG: tRNA (guanosine(46)-N7)-methyltransferase TrmB [Clostridiales bacterium]|jgi:tRNA (guanine-N7-)-methyltransferase|nr:tRNA (guanosine(46)-N7)-methyltransferase TrmB [Clostridiales bacterium]